jgi:hypothetical protein
MGEIDAAGEIVTGALLGRAVEPHAGEGHGHGTICLNCGTALIGAHCHQCGQSAHVHRSLGGIGHEILHGVFHFEGKLWRTLPLLAWRPGQLTRRYIDGERARFVSPVALFLFSIFALFAVFSMLGVVPQSDYGAVARNPQELAEVKRELTEAQAQLVTRRAGLAGNDAAAKALDQQIKAYDARIEAAKVGRIMRGPIEADFDIHTGWERLDHGVEKAMKNPGLTAYKLQSNSYKFSWLLIPLSLPFVWLMFAWKRQFHLYDHAVFVTYSIAFMSLLFIALSALAAIGLPNGWLNLAGMLIAPVHIYSQLKDTYGLSRFGAIARTILLGFFILVIVLLFGTIILAMGVVG